MSSDPIQPDRFEDWDPERPPGGWRGARLRAVVALPATIVYGLILYLLIWGFRDAETTRPLLAGLVLTPVCITSLWVMLSDPMGTRTLKWHAKRGYAVLGILLILSILLFNEGGICIAMALPFFFLGGQVGLRLTHRALAHYRGGAGRGTTTFVAVLPALMLMVEPYIDYGEHYNSVTTVIEIAASPEEVWQHTVEIPDVRRDELHFTFSHNILGVPRPENAAMEGTGVGAVRQLRWTKGVRFQEIITEWDENRRLVWDFHFGPDAIPRAVEAHISVSSDYLKLATGEYVLEPLEDGGTRLTLTTHYVISTPFNAYCDLWGERFLQDFHGAVLQVIKARAEA